MRSWLAVLLLLLVAAGAAYGWHALALDPGSVVLRFAGWRIETSFVFAVIGLLLLWGLATVFWRLLVWPRVAWQRRSRRRGRERIADGLLALIEGRYARATRDLDRASQVAQLHAPALLARAQAAHRRGDHAAADEALDEAAKTAMPAALTLRGAFLLERNRAADALLLLKPALGGDGPPNPGLSPAAWLTLHDAALRCGDATTALAALTPLARSELLPASEFDRLEAATLAAALAATKHVDALNRLWSGFSRSQRRVETVIVAYAVRAAALGLPLAAMSELEAALRRDWSEALVRAYGELGPAEASSRLRQAETWLDAQPNSASLLLTLGRLCNQTGLWGKAREYLLRGLSIAPAPALWEALGEACAGQGDAEAARRAYRNALLEARGEPVESLPELGRSALDTRASVVEERSEHGVPRLLLPRS